MIVIRILKIMLVDDTIQEADIVGKEHFYSRGGRLIILRHEVTVQYKSSFLFGTVSLTRWAIVY